MCYSWYILFSKELTKSMNCKEIDFFLCRKLGEFFQASNPNWKLADQKSIETDEGSQFCYNLGK